MSGPETSARDAADGASTSLSERLARMFAEDAPTEAASVLDGLPAAASAAFIDRLPDERRADLVGRMNRDAAASVLDVASDEAAAALLHRLDEVRAAALLSRLSEGRREQRLSLLPARRARALLDVLEFPVGTAGRLMDPRVATFRETTSAEQALAQVRLISGRRVTDLVVADDAGKFAGVVSLQDVVGAEPGARLAELMNRHAVTVGPMASREDVRDALDQHKLASLPVVGVDGVVLGIIRHDALVRAAEQALGGTLQQMVGANAEERALSSPWVSIKSRLPWLQINLGTAFLASAVVSIFDATIAQFTALAVLMPVVAGQSGNTGAQALAVVSRGLALREIRASHIWAVLRKEAAAAFFNGIAVSIVTCIGVYLWSGNPGLVAVIGISMVISMLLAALAGGAIPIILTALGRDPATASSIVLTTVTDVCGFFSFLGLATLLSSWLASGG